MTVFLTEMFARKQLLRNVYAFGVGSVAGATVGMVGWGGAQIILPAMTASSTSILSAVANYSQLSATGISLSSLSISTLTSGYKFWNDSKVDVPLALAIGIPAVLSARLGSHFAKKLSGDALALFFNGFSILLIPTHFWIQQRAETKRRKQEPDPQSTADGRVKAPPIAEATKRNSSSILHRVDTTNGTTSSILNPISLPKNSQEDDEAFNPKLIHDLPKLVQHMSYGLLSGLVSALMGVGGLPLTMSYITETTNLHHHYVQGTAICAVIPSILVSAGSRLNVIPFQAATCVALGAMVGGYGGAQIALDLTEEQLRHLYMTSLVVFGSRSTYGAIQNIKAILRKRR